MLVKVVNFGCVRLFGSQNIFKCIYVLILTYLHFFLAETIPTDYIQISLLLKKLTDLTLCCSQTVRIMHEHFVTIKLVV